VSSGLRSTSAVRRDQATLCVTSACAVALFLVYGRIFTVSVLPPFARTVSALSVAGLAVGGVIALLWRRGFDEPVRARRISRWVAGFGFSAPFSSLMVVEHVPIDQTLSTHGLVTLGVASLILALPFVLAGIIGAATLRSHEGLVDRRWASVVGGGAFGVLLAMACLSLLPPNVVPLVVGGIACWAALLLAVDAEGSMRGPIVAAVLVGALSILAIGQDVFRFYYVKAWTSEYTEDLTWNATSRVALFPAAAGQTATRTLPLARGADGYAAMRVPEFKWLDVDGANWTPMLRFDGDLGRVRFLLDSVVYAAHRVRTNARVLVVGVGGGRDLLAARTAGQTAVVGVEPNPAMRSMVEERFAHYSGRPYGLDGVDVLLGSPRTILPRLRDPFDVIQLSTPTDGGLLPFLPADEYLYTREAFREYYRLLTPSGVLSVTRYFSPQYPFEVLRVLATVRDTWGLVDPSRHLIVLGQDFSATVLARREAFTPAELDAIAGMASATGMTMLLDPRRMNAGTDEIDVLAGAAARDLDAGRFDYRPISDDRPFFTHVVRSPTGAIVADPFGVLRRDQAGFALLSLLGLVAVVLAAACAGVAATARDAEGRLPLTLLLYFAATGFGPVALVVPLLERMRLVLGSDVAAVIVGACVLGLAGAGGSLASRLAGRNGDGAGTRTISLVLAVASAIVALVLWRLGAPAGASLVLSALLAAIVLAPLGALLGMTLPLGVAAAQRPAVLAAATATYAAGAVAAVAVVVPLAMRVGMSGVVATGAIAFAVAAACNVRRGRRPSAAAEESDAQPAQLRVNL
jgi:SAM-dependent methyltransferase